MSCMERQLDDSNGTPVGFVARRKAVKMRKPLLTESDLQQFTGTERWYRHALVRNVTFTDGAKYLAHHAGAYWLLDIIAFAQPHTAGLANEYFQTWRLTVNADASATVVCTDGNDKELYRQAIPYTDFPLSEMTLYCCRDGVLGYGVDWVILLPREY